MGGTMRNLCGIVAAILKMATGRNFSMSGIISGHHNLPTYEMSLKSDNVEIAELVLNNNLSLIPCLYPYTKENNSLITICIYPYTKNSLTTISYSLVLHT
jgi:hypothetical protein